MFLNNRFSKKNSLLYKSKCINTRNSEYIGFENTNYDKCERYTGENNNPNKKKKK